jgi:type II secretory pathway component PulF
MASYPYASHGRRHVHGEPSKRSIHITGLLLLSVAVIWCAVGATLLFAVPSYERVFRDQNVSLPHSTVWAVAAGHWAQNYWYILPAFGLLVLPVVVVLSWLFRHRVESSVLSWAWFGALIGVPLLLEAGIWLALWLP